MDCLANLPRRTWRYGTQKRVTVISIVTKSGDSQIFACKEDLTSEGFILLRRGLPDAKAGDRGVITFKQGGPAGEYWDYEKVESQGI